MSSDTLSDMYTGSADLGRFITTISLIIFSIVGIVLIIYGFNQLRNKNPHTEKVTANITSVQNCFPTDKKFSDCRLLISFTANGKNYSGSLTIDSSDYKYEVGNSIDIYYNKDDPSDFSIISRDDQSSKGKILIIIGVVVILGSFFVWWLARTFKMFAAAEGAGVILRGVTGRI